jgi:hypothetical protein
VHDFFAYDHHYSAISVYKKRTVGFETKVAFTIPSLFPVARTTISLFLSSLTTTPLFLSAVGIDFDNGRLGICCSERSNGRAALFFFPVLVLRDGVHRNGRW